MHSGTFYNTSEGHDHTLWNKFLEIRVKSAISLSSLKVQFSLKFVACESLTVIPFSIK